MATRHAAQRKYQPTTDAILRASWNFWSVGGRPSTKVKRRRVTFDAF